MLDFLIVRCEFSIEPNQTFWQHCHPFDIPKTTYLAVGLRETETAEDSSE